MGEWTRVAESRRVAGAGEELGGRGATSRNPEREKSMFRFAGFAQQPLCKIERATQGAPTHPIPRAKAGERGATWKRRCDHVILINNFVKSSHETFHLCKLLDSDAGEAAWNYCGAQLHAILEHSPSCHSWEWFLQPQDFNFQLHPPSHD